MEIFKISGLSFSYPESDKLALDNINISINQGEFVTMCGKSGCGKSTLLRHFKTCLTPYGRREGKIFFQGVTLDDVHNKTQASKIGYVMQNPDNQIVTDKVWHELAFGLESLAYDNRTIRLRVAEMASFFGIENWFMKNVSELSGGQKQLLNLAAIMAMQPDVLILDEPTSQLDPIAASDFLEAIKKINTDIGTTVIVSEHRLEEVFPMSDRIIVIDKGRVIGNDSPRQIGNMMVEKNNDMLEAMPSSVKVYAAINDNYHTCPLTVKECRAWLNEKFVEQDIKFRSLTKENNKPINTETAVELNDVWFKYEKDGDDIIKDLSLVVKKGQFYAIVGGNGTGKTTALSIISGINHAYRGKVLLKGKNIKKYKKEELFYHNLGVLPQNPQSLFVTMSVEKDLYEMLKDTKLSEKAIEEEINKVSELLEIKELMHMHPYDLSGGEQQKLALAKILLLKPEIIMLDEPTKAIDSHFKKKLGNILKYLQKRGTTIIMVSHDIEFCAEYADICSLFFNGSIVTTNEPANFFSGNSFYTTHANMLSRNIFEKAITAEDVIKLCKKNLNLLTDVQ